MDRYVSIQAVLSRDLIVFSEESNLHDLLFAKPSNSRIDNSLVKMNFSTHNPHS